MGVLLWVLIIGGVAGTIARVLMPGPNRPKGFVLTIVLGVAGAFLELTSVTCSACTAREKAQAL